MSLLFRIIIVCVFVICCNACEYDDIPNYVLAVGDSGQALQGNFYEALDYCTMKSMTLVTPDTKTKNDALIIFIRVIGSIWTSGNDLAKEGTFVWRTNGEKLSFTNWAAQPPQPGNGSSLEHCVDIVANYGFKWNDNKCNVMRAIVCEETTTKVRTC